VSDEIVDAAVGYDHVANAYDDWHWQHFWLQNEMPVVAAAVGSSRAGMALDVGTGTGRYIKLLRQLRHHVSGIDVSSRMLARASESLGGSEGLTVADLRAMPFRSSKFDLLTCCRVLSHVKEIDVAFAEFRRVLRHGGLVVMTDVDSRHDYTATRIPVAGSNVFIKVHKHSTGELALSANAQGFRLLANRTFCANELPWKPDRYAFPAIDWSGSRPIFSLLVLEAP
jgi:ubiquinone/menaquinone biosynthesis C-methylase UbiE